MDILLPSVIKLDMVDARRLVHVFPTFSLFFSFNCHFFDVINSLEFIVCILALFQGLPHPFYASSWVSVKTPPVWTCCEIKSLRIRFVRVVLATDRTISSSQEIKEVQLMGTRCASCLDIGTIKYIGVMGFGKIYCIYWSMVLDSRTRVTFGKIDKARKYTRDECEF
jgi:hypothetical protein